MKTPTTTPRPSQAEMHPGHAHHSTAKTPDSGLRLGFTDISEKHETSLAEAQNTPTKTLSTPGIPKHLTSPGFEFKFATQSSLSSEAQKLMDTVREEAARIKEQMKLERDEGGCRVSEELGSFDGVNAKGRKIAQPKGKAGRFSDVHMAEFKRMDSIANHASAFRARPGYLQPTTGSLKRTGSKAGLEEEERPRTAGKTLSPVKASTAPRRRPGATSPSKTAVIPSTDSSLSGSPSKRPRFQGAEDVKSNAAISGLSKDAPRSATQPRTGFGFSSNILTPTKSSLARSATMNDLNTSPGKVSMLQRSASIKNLKSVTPAKALILDKTDAANSTAPSSAPKDLRSPPGKDGTRHAPPTRDGNTNKPLPKVPTGSESSSKLPKFSGLKSILRRHQPLYSNDPIKIAAGTHVASPLGGSKINQHLSNLSSDGVGTPDRRMTMGVSVPSTKKRVEFTSSTKSRHDLALASPSPSKIPTKSKEKRPGTPYAPPAMFDPAAYLLSDDVHYPRLNLGSSSEPSSPPATCLPHPVNQVRQQEVLSRDSPGFKSIFTTLHPRPQSSGQDKSAQSTRSPSSSPFKPSPSTIRHVRESVVDSLYPALPFEDLQTVPHGIPGKKRRRESTNEIAEDMEKNTENRRISVMPSVPGGFPSDSPRSSDGPNAKRRKLFAPEGVAKINDPASMKENVNTTVSPTKKPNVARTAAANAAKERKGGKGFLTMSRLNMLSRPKERK